MTPEVAAYLNSWLGDNPYPENCRPASYYVEKTAQFEAQPISEGCTIMLGDSITDFADWNSLFPGCNIINRGIAGDMLEGIILRLDEIARHNPSQVFFMAGGNNFIKNSKNTPETVAALMEEFFKAFRKKLPDTPLHVQSLLPMNTVCLDYTETYNGNTEKINGFLKANQARYNYDFIEIAAKLSDDKGQLRADLTTDGCHPNDKAYGIWAEIIKDRIVK